METSNEKKTRRFNVIDILILLVVVAAVVIAVYKFAGKKIVENTSSEEYYITFTQDEVANTTANSVHEGDAVLDEAGNNSLGKVFSINVGPSRSYAANSEGKWIRGEKEGFSSISVTAKVKAVKGDNGITINGAKYLVGHTMTLDAGNAKIWVLITDISKNPPAAQ